jgi:hypothetical protein
VASEQTESNRPRQWKRINQVKIATLNVQALYTAGTTNFERNEYRVDIRALQKIIWPGKGTVIKKNYIILYSGHKSDKH